MSSNQAETGSTAPAPVSPAQYHSMWVIRQLIEHLPEMEPADVNGLWTSIISVQFPRGYITEPQSNGGSMEIRVFHWTSRPSSAGNIKLPFFTVMCYHYEREGDPRVWIRGCTKLNNTLRRVSLVEAQGYYAAIAVGRYVRFFQARQGVLAPFHGETPLNLGNDNAVVQEILDEIRDNHVPS